MSASRKSHYAYVRSVDVPVLGVAAHNAHRLLGIADWHLYVAVGHAIVQNNGCNTHIVEEGRPLCALMIHCQKSVSAARANHHGTSGGTLCVRQIHLYVGGVLQSVLVRDLGSP